MKTESVKLISQVPTVVEDDCGKRVEGGNFVATVENKRRNFTTRSSKYLILLQVTRP